MRFNFLDWMNMSMAVDIAFLVFAAAVIWKFKRQQKQILTNQETSLDNVHKILMHKMFSQDLAKRIDLQTESILELNNDIQSACEGISQLEEDLETTMRNPQEARRLLKERKKEVNIEQQ